MTIYYCQGTHKQGRPLRVVDGKCKECGPVQTTKSTFEDSTVNSPGFAYPLHPKNEIKEINHVPTLSL